MEIEGEGDTAVKTTEDTFFGVELKNEMHVLWKKCWIAEMMKM